MSAPSLHRRLSDTARVLLSFIVCLLSSRYMYRDSIHTQLNMHSPIPTSLSIAMTTSIVDRGTWMMMISPCSHNRSIVIPEDCKFDPQIIS